MKLAKILVTAIALSSMGAIAVPAQPSAAQQVTALLREFLDAAGRNDRAVFDKFFADDVVYTRATGVVMTKARIMKNLERPARASEGKNTYSAKDILVHEYGDTVVVAFRLVDQTQHVDGKMETSSYRNTGTFLRRHGRWQAVAWQATKLSGAAKAK